MRYSRVWGVGVLVLLALVLTAACGAQPSPVPSTADEVPRVRARELKTLLDAGEQVVIIDTRSLAAYQANHIPGAISLPLEELELRQSELPRQAKIVTYCT